MQSQLPQWRRRHSFLPNPTSIVSYLHAKTLSTLAVVFATWPSMHDPISNLLNAPPTEADRLTEKWTDAKLKELNYVGISVRRTPSAFRQRSFPRAANPDLAACIRARSSPAPSPRRSPGTRSKTTPGAPRRAGSARSCWR